MAGRAWVGGVCALAAWTLGGTDAAAQSTYRLANGSTSVLQVSSGFMEADFGEARLGFAGVYRFGSGPFAVAAQTSAGVRAEQWDMFAAMDWVPGLEVGARLVIAVVERPRASTRLSVGLGFRTVERKIAVFVDDTSTLMRISEETQRDLIAGVGLHQQITPTTLLGVAATVRRQFGSPGTARPTQICVPTQSAGGWYSVPICNDRYLDQLEDRWTTQLRGDALVGVRQLSSGGILPSLGIVAAASMDVLAGAPGILNLGAGPAILSARYPGQMIVAVLFEVRDALDVEDTVPDFYPRLGLDPAEFVDDFGYRFGFRLVVSVPFPVFLEHR